MATVTKPLHAQVPLDTCKLCFGAFRLVAMANSSGSESDEALGIDWSILEDSLSAGALQSLQQHLKVMKLIGSRYQRKRTTRRTDQLHRSSS